jgi:tellurite resistance protein
MFLIELAHAEREAFWSLANLMVAADGKIAPEEAAMLEDLQSQLGIDAGGLQDTSDVSALALAIKEPSHRAISLMELASLAYVDGSYDEPEKELLRTIGGLWGLDKVIVMQAEEWGRKRVALTAEAVRLMQEASI